MEDEQEGVRKRRGWWGVNMVKVFICMYENP
jgi:hypothetical protein